MYKVLKSFTYAFAGILYFFTKDRNGKVEGCIFIAIIFLGFIYNISTTEWAIILCISALVLALEMVNHAIETICNKIEPQHNAQIKVIKDLAAGAVLWASILAVIIGLLIFGNKIFG